MVTAETYIRRDLCERFGQRPAWTHLGFQLYGFELYLWNPNSTQSQTERM